MTIASEISRVDYIGNGAVDTYAYTFRVFDDSHLLVTIRDTSDVETTLTLTTDYTVTGVGTSGGNVVLVDADQSWLDADGDLLTGYTLTIRRVLPLTQETDIRNQGDFYPESHEDEFDKLVMVDQQQQAQIDGSFRLPETIDPGDVSTVLPIPVANRTIGWNATADALENFANAGDLVVTAYIETLLDDVDASTAQTTLGISTYVKTILDDTTALAARATLGIPTATELSSSDQLNNMSLTATVGSNALTIALKTAAGTNASSTDPIVVGFRSATPATGTYSQVAIAAAMSTVVSSGSTAGFTSGQIQYLYVYLLNNAGTVELAWSKFLFDEGSVVSTTAEGGAGAADSGIVMYSTTARTNVGFRLIARLKFSLTTAGTWDEVPDEISLAPFKKIQGPTVQRFTSGSGTYTTPTGVSYLKVKMVGGGGGGSGSGTVSSMGTGGTGGTTTFGSSLLTATGGAGGAVNADPGVTVGTATVASPAITIVAMSGSRGAGYGRPDGANADFGGGLGGCSPFGGNGSVTYGSAGYAAIENSGSGGSGAGIDAATSGFPGSGGASGGYIEAIIPNPAATYSYAVGASGAAGTAGTSGLVGGAGGSGIVIVEEIY